MNEWMNEWRNLLFHFLSTGSNCSNKLRLHTRINFNRQHKHHVRFDSYCFFCILPLTPPPPIECPIPHILYVCTPLATNRQFPLFSPNSFFQLWPNFVLLFFLYEDDLLTHRLNIFLLPNLCFYHRSTTNNQPNGTDTQTLTFRICVHSCIP